VLQVFAIILSSQSTLIEGDATVGASPNGVVPETPAGKPAMTGSAAHCVATLDVGDGHGAALGTVVPKFLIEGVLTRGAGKPGSQPGKKQGSQKADDGCDERQKHGIAGQDEGQDKTQGGTRKKNVGQHSLLAVAPCQRFESLPKLCLFLGGIIGDRSLGQRLR
jgi:hypothetical protein